MLDVVHCQPEHIETLTHMLSRAFLNDPLYEFTFPEAESRAELGCWEMRGLLRYGVLFGEVIAPLSMAGCAIWLPPGQTDFTGEREAEAGLLDLGKHFGKDAEEQLNLFNIVTEAAHRRLVPSPHWYLLLLGVDPACQGQGIGSSLITPKLAEADRNGEAIYLETTNPRNIPFYKKHGFEVQFEERLGVNGPAIWYMVREPKSRGIPGTKH